MALTKSQILGALPLLSQDELREIGMVCTSLGGGSVAPKFHYTTSGNEVAIYDAMASVLGAAVPLASLPERTQQRFAQKVPSLLGFFDTELKGWDSNRIAQKSFLLEMMDLLRSDIKSLEITPTFNTMINNFHRMYQVFDHAFPGYRESGMVQLIFDFEKTTAQAVRKRSPRVAKTKTPLKDNT